MENTVSLKVNSDDKICYNIAISHTMPKIDSLAYISIADSQSITLTTVTYTAPNGTKFS